MAFASPTLAEHLARGAVGGGALTLAIGIAPAHPWIALALMPVALIAFRGCPICWTTGLIETLAYRVLKRADPKD